MDTKAANFGDRMKHALLAELLLRTHGWPQIAYSETHAGAGTYLVHDQAKVHHITELRERVKEADRADHLPGSPYLKFLRNWWESPSHYDSYPGSALIATRWFERYRDTQWQVRLTEADVDNFKRLSDSLGPRASLRANSFLPELDWLTELDSLIILVDPFGVVTNFDETQKCAGIDRGWIDHQVIRDLLNRLQSKNKAILSLWWGFGQALGVHHRCTCDLLLKYARTTKGVTCRIFHDNRNHANAVVGFNAAADIISTLPTRRQWKVTWLRDVVHERIDAVDG